MRTTPPIGAALLLGSAFAIASSTKADVIVDDAAIVSNPNPQLVLTKSLFMKVGLFAIDLATVSPSQYRFTYAGIAEKYALYPAAYGTTVDPTFAASTTPLVSNDNNPGSNVQVFAPGESKYFAYWDDRTMFDNTPLPGPGDNYGWALITRTASGLEVTSSATAVGGGIIAGTSTQVPEPSSAFLTIAGTTLALARRRSRRHPA